MKDSMRTLLIAWLGLPCAACFQYSAFQPPAPDMRVGTELRAELDQPSRFQLSEVAVDNVATVEGEFIEWSADTLMLSVLWLKAREGAEYRGRGETIVVPGARLGRLERKGVSLPRTLGLVGVAVLGSALLSTAMTGGAGGNNGGTLPPPTR